MVVLAAVQAMALLLEQALQDRVTMVVLDLITLIIHVVAVAVLTRLVGVLHRQQAVLAVQAKQQP
jgi:hypothetical protein